MSRSNYSDDCEQWQLICWRGAVASAMRGSRGQHALKDLLAALDAMPEKELIAHELERAGHYCALGVLGQARGLQLSDLDPEEYQEVAVRFNLAGAFVQEIVYMNDEGYWSETESPQHRFGRMRQWVASHIVTS